ncbi:MAG TPA: hypothetical protein DEG43_11920 [Acidimicrobiaceae bacterium]|nr:hypothetical protein [Acidimicrobiaceae bacterium]
MAVEFQAMIPQRVTLGADVGGTKTLGVLVTRDPSGAPVILNEAKIATPQTATELVDTLVLLVETLMGCRPAPGQPVTLDGVVAQLDGIGLGLPGYIGLDGIARQAPNLKYIIGHDVGAAVAERLGVPVRVDNDANCGAWAAHQCDEPAADSLVMVTLGTGIGGGMILGGQLVRGANGFASEFGHMVIDPDGPRCVCGQSGCWELSASGNAFGRLVKEALASGRVHPLSASEAALAPGEAVLNRLSTEVPDDQRAAVLEVLDDYCAAVALGVANLVNLCDPEVVSLSGGIVAAGQPLLDGLDRALRVHATVFQGRSPRLRIFSGGASAGALGAALLAESLSGTGHGAS